ncbi:MAG: GNAT family N-acetyltransferase [Sedimenticola sp.]|nr:MAG: GNAT family N-acetyltransferase [Sedimenticola sp.]
MHIRNAEQTDFARILELNLESEHFLSPLDRDHLIKMHGQSTYHRVVEHEDEVIAFLLALPNGVDYQSPNYRWFGEEFDNFLYVDRIVVSPLRHGQGVASLLYRDLFDFGRSSGMACIACEFDIDPMNQPSKEFHQKFGFKQVGTQWVGEGKKRVSLQIAEFF